MLFNVVLYVSAFTLLAILAVIGIMQFNIENRKCILLTLLAIFFPLNIQFLGKDALTTGSIFVLLSYVVFIINSFKHGTPAVRPMDWLIYLLILFGAVGNLLAFRQGLVEVEDLGPMIRQYFSFATSLLFLVVVKDVVQDEYAKEGAQGLLLVERLFSIVIVLTAVHVLISMMNKYVPATNDWVEIFYPKEAEALSPEGQDRIKSFVFGYEYYAEMLASLTPVVVYKMATTRKPLWFGCLVVFSCGLFLSVTRSGIVLFLLGLAASFLYQFRKNLVAGSLLILSLVGSLVGFVLLYPQGLSAVLERFSMAESVHEGGGGVFDTINRGNFPEIWERVSSELNLFGYSMLRIDFHNLFLTTLHQMGLIGALLFFTVLLTPPLRVVRSFFTGSRDLKPLIFACLLFVALFFTNETKVEFTRSASYMQICFLLLGLCYLVSKFSKVERAAGDDAATGE